MIAIQKKEEPAGLMRLRQQAAAAGLSSAEAYKKLKNPLKERVRNSLIQEQGHLCAYCMCRIPRPDVEPGITKIRIEHITPRNPIDGQDASQGLDYNNFAAVCNGNMGPHGIRTIADLTCDAHKGNSEFKKINPCSPNTLQSIFYMTDGKIDASDPDVKSDLLSILNLNCPSSPLVAERKETLDSLISDISDQAGDNEEHILDYCTSVLEAFRAEIDPKTPYVGILIWYLETMAAALNVT